MSMEANRRRAARGLYLESWRLGAGHLFRSLASGRAPSWREAVKRLLVPMDLTRYYELSRAVCEFRDAELVLDLSSPKLAAFYAARRHPSSTYVAIDRFQRELRGWEPIRRTARLQNLSLQAADMTQLPYRNGVFDRVYSLSVIEHLPDKLDEAALREIRRVLKPGGWLQITIPFAAKYKEKYLEQSIYEDSPSKGGVFFFRYYDRERYEKKFRGAGWRIEAEEICEEAPLPLTRWFESLAPWSYLSGPWLGLFAAVNFRVRGYGSGSPAGHADLYACFQKTPEEPKLQGA
ncbi:MAG: class I SAM-dependent methyltransferase [Verrucomicrobiae bacterium]|nr:class I SAM-dependent methyltransferase [Verrucomicrobiae bacterium]